MVRNATGVLAPLPDAMERSIRKIVTMHDEEYSRVGWGAGLGLSQLRFGEGESENLPLVLPPVPGPYFLTINEKI